MQADVGSPVLPDMLSALRTATGPSHERLDASFGSLPLSTRPGLTRFLASHAIGLAPLFPIFQPFVENVLRLECPDYPAMLHADLAALGTDPDSLPTLASPPAVTTPTAPDELASAGLGTGYVVCGSRLGLAMIRQRGYWGEAQGFRSAYMTDGRGHEAWKALVSKLRGHTFRPHEIDAARAAALAAFATFASAFDLSGSMRQPTDG